MKLSEFKKILTEVVELNFTLMNGTKVPAHFHITEAGLTTKRFIDCGGTNREEHFLSFQLWVSTDEDHRLSPEKVLNIISIAEDLYIEDDIEVEIEYQTTTISRFALAFENNTFVLLNKQTDCLAKDSCGVPTKKVKKQLATITADNKEACCTPGGGCC